MVSSTAPPLRLHCRSGPAPADNAEQADGFNVDLLPKKKDTKSTDNQSNLLEYIVRPCCLREEITPKASQPVPVPNEVEQCTKVKFKEIRKELQKFSNELERIKAVTKVVLDKSSEERKQPFGTKMSEVLKNAEEEIRNLQDLVKQSHLCFIKTLRYFRHAPPKKGKFEDVMPEEFFSSWLLFCQDYKTIWKKDKVLILHCRPVLHRGTSENGEQHSAASSPALQAGPALPDQ
jgi:formin 2